MTPVIELKNINAGYNGTAILKDINLSVKEHDFLGIIGPNGGGKSTLVKVILGLLKPFSGEVRLRPGIRTGYLPQFSLSDRKFPISVKETVLSGLNAPDRIFRKYSAQEMKSAEEMIERFELGDLSSKQIGELSGGQVQRVFLCRAMVSRPDLLILDEPNSFVDREFSRDLYKMLLELNRDITILMVSHDTGVITSYVKNIACVNYTLHYHPGNDITSEILDKYTCPVELITHGTLPHRVLREHSHDHEHEDGKHDA